MNFSCSLLLSIVQYRTKPVPASPGGGIMLKFISICSLFLTLINTAHADVVKLDSHFANAGILNLTENISENNLNITSLHSIDRNKILLVGTGGNYGTLGHSRIYFFKVDENGNLDTNFGPNGEGYNYIENSSLGFQIYQTKIDSQGRIYFGTNVGLYRINSQGILDDSFSEDGHVNLRDLSSYAGEFPYMNYFVLNQNSLPVVAFDYLNGDEGYIRVIQLLENGELDSSFSSDGYFDIPRVSERFNVNGTLSGFLIHPSLGFHFLFHNPSQNNTYRNIDLYAVDSENQFVMRGGIRAEMGHNRDVYFAPIFELRRNNNILVSARVGHPGTFDATILTQFITESTEEVRSYPKTSYILPNDHHQSAARYSSGFDSRGNLLSVKITSSYPGLYRFKSDGSLDESFHSSGSINFNQIMTINMNTDLTKVLFTPGGEIYLTGGSNQSIKLYKLFIFNDEEPVPYQDDSLKEHAEKFKETYPSLQKKTPVKEETPKAKQETPKPKIQPKNLNPKT